MREGERRERRIEERDAERTEMEIGREEEMRELVLVDVVGTHVDWDGARHNGLGEEERSGEGKGETERRGLRNRSKGRESDRERSGD